MARENTSGSTRRKNPLRRVTTVYPRNEAVEALGGYSIPRLNLAIELIAAMVSRTPDRVTDLTKGEQLQFGTLIQGLKPNPNDWYSLNLKLAGLARLQGMTELENKVAGWSMLEAWAVLLRHGEELSNAG